MGTSEGSYYRAALTALRHVEHHKPTGRRFGPNADARWASFRGDLTTADRIDLLVRDADAQWPGAFGARTVFAKRAVAEDESFGADWAPLDPVDAEELWREVTKASAPATARETLTQSAEAWGIHLSPVDVGRIGAAEKLLVVGPSAVVATIDAFAAGGSSLDWADQVTVVATPPGHRQLAAVGGALLSAVKPTRVVTAEGATGAKGYRLILSQDADAADAAKARVLVGG